MRQRGDNTSTSRPCERRNPYAVLVVFENVVQGLFAQPLMPVVMGPCFRRDDGKYRTFARDELPPIQFSNSIVCGRSFAISPRVSREVCRKTSCPSKRGRRECRALDAPAAWWAEKNSHTSIVTTVTPETPSIPRAMVLTSYFVLSPVNRAFLPPSSAELPPPT